MQIREVCLAVVVLSGTQFTGTAATLGGFIWLLVSCFLTVFLFPFGQQLLVKKIWERRPRYQKTIFAKAKEIHRIEELNETTVRQILPSTTTQQNIDKTFKRISELETKLEGLCSILQRRSPVDGLLKNRITMSDTNLLTCSNSQEPCQVRWSAASSSGDLRQVPSDLSHFRRRIDDSIREQRKTREIVEEAQDKLRNLRQHQAQVEASLASGPSTPRFSDHYRSSKKRHYLHRSMSSLEEELNSSSKVFTTGDGGNSQFLQTDGTVRPSSSGGRLRSNNDKNVSFINPPDFDVTISWPFQPDSNSTPISTRGMASQSELYASHSYRLMLLEDMLSSCKLQLETSLRANASANSEVHLSRDRLIKLQDENKSILDRAAHFETKYKHLIHLVQPRLYDLRNQTRSLQQRLSDVSLDVKRELENYKENFALNIQTLHSLIQRANWGNLRSKLTDLSTELNIQERHRREAEAETYQHKRQNLQLSNKIEHLNEALQSKETTISILEQDFHEEREKTQKLEEQNEELFREKSNLKEEREELANKLLSLRQKLEVAREERDKFSADSRRLTSELSQLRSASEARVEQLNSELNEAAMALESEREGWFKRQDSFRNEIKKQSDILQEKLEEREVDLEAERNHSLDQKTRIEELQMQIRQNEEHISDLKRRVHGENTQKLQDLERQLANAQQIALQATSDWKKYEQRVNEVEAELHEYKLQFERERREKIQAQNDFDSARNELEKSELILKETGLEKQHLLKSVSTFEQENRSLKKTCKDLSNQIDIYQKDTDSKYAKILEQKRTKEQDEIKRLKSEIDQMRKVHDQREQNLYQRLNETSVNFSKLKELYDRRAIQERDQPPSSTFVSTLPQPAYSSIQTSTVIRRITSNSSSTSKLGRQV